MKGLYKLQCTSGGESANIPVRSFSLGTEAGMNKAQGQRGSLPWGLSPVLSASPHLLNVTSVSSQN